MPRLAHPICTYGELRYHFAHAQQGTNFLRFVFRPKKKTYTTYLFRAVLILLVCFFLAMWVFDSAWWFLSTMLMEVVFLYFAELEVQKGVKLEFPEHSAVQNIDRQPMSMRRTIIKYAYFTARLAREHVQPSLIELENTLKLAEIYRTGRPSGLTSLLRHPIVILILGTIAYSFNETIKKAPATSADWTHFMLVCWVVSIAMLFAGIAHMIRTLEPTQQWMFECCLRWYQLEKDATGSRYAPAQEIRLNLL